LKKLSKKLSSKKFLTPLPADKVNVSEYLKKKVNFAEDYLNNYVLYKTVNKN